MCICNSKTLVLFLLSILFCCMILLSNFSTHKKFSKREGYSTTASRDDLKQTAESSCSSIGRRDKIVKHKAE